MSYLPDVKVTCDVRRGARLDTEKPAVQYNGNPIGDVLAMNFDEAVEFFSARPEIQRGLRLLRDD